MCTVSGMPDKVPPRATPQSTMPLRNPFRGAGLPTAKEGEWVSPSTDAHRVARLLARCPVAGETPLAEVAELAEQAGIGALYLKDERDRMGLGSFKALGAAYVIAADAEGAGSEKLSGRVYVAASAGNHGLSVAAGARVFGAEAVIYLADTVPAGFAARLETEGARVVRSGATYEDSMAAATQAAEEHGWTLLADTSWPGYFEIPRRVMEGYLQMSAEIAAALESPPSHVFLQAGVGGMAAALAAHLRQVWGDCPVIVVVEPDAAPALMESIRAGNAVTTEGPVSTMGRLDCKQPSLIALAGLARDSDYFMTVSDREAETTAALLARHGLATTPSGAAGLAAVLAADRTGLGLDPQSRVLVVISEDVEG